MSSKSRNRNKIKFLNYFLKKSNLKKLEENTYYRSVLAKILVRLKIENLGKIREPYFKYIKLLDLLKQQQCIYWEKFSMFLVKKVFSFPELKKKFFPILYPLIDDKKGFFLVKKIKKLLDKVTFKFFRNLFIFELVFYIQDLRLLSLHFLTMFSKKELSFIEFFFSRRCLFLTEINLRDLSKLFIKHLLEKYGCFWFFLNLIDANYLFSSFNCSDHFKNLYKKHLFWGYARHSWFYEDSFLNVLDFLFYIRFSLFKYIADLAVPLLEIRLIPTAFLRYDHDTFLFIMASIEKMFYKNYNYILFFIFLFFVGLFIFLVY